QRVDHAAEQLGADRDLQDAVGGLDRVAFRQMLVVAKDHGADRILLQIERQAEGVAGELQHFTVLGVRQPVDAGNAVGDRHDGADVASLSDRFEVLDPLLDQVADLGCLDGHVSSPLANFVQAVSSYAMRLSRASTEPSITRSPARTTAPPMSFGSVSQCRRTERLSLRSRALESVFCCAASSGAADVTVTSTTPSALSFSSSKSAAISVELRRRHVEHEPRELRGCHLRVAEQVLHALVLHDSGASLQSVRPLRQALVGTGLLERRFGVGSRNGGLVRQEMLSFRSASRAYR